MPHTSARKAAVGKLTMRLDWRICARSVKCCANSSATNSSTAVVNDQRTAVERIVRKISAAMIATAAPKAKPSARNSMSEVKMGSPGSTKIVSRRITSGSARKVVAAIASAATRFAMSSSARWLCQSAVMRRANRTMTNAATSRITQHHRVG